MKSISGHDVRLAAAVLGGAALVAFGVMSVEIAQHGAGQDATASAGVTVGAVPEATTTTVPLAVGTEERAEPAITGPAPLFPGESPNHTPRIPPVPND